MIACATRPVTSTKGEIAELAIGAVESRGELGRELEH